jgi:hypothetical protein
VHSGKNLHHGFTSGCPPANTDVLKADNRQNGVLFAVKAMIHASTGDAPNGVVLIRKP